MHKTIKIFDAKKLTGGLTRTTKMPCKSYSLPTESCVTGFKMSQIKGSICSECYANKGNYRLYENNIKPSQFARLDSINNPFWVDSMIRLIGNDSYFRWHDSGDLQSVDHLNKIVLIALGLPDTLFWLPTREYGIIKDFIFNGETIPENLIVRLSAMYVDMPVIVPKSLQGIKNITTSNVHTSNPIGFVCNAPKQGNKCLDCRACWSNVPVSYQLH